MSVTVVKVGGSLYDWNELGPRLRLFLATLPSPVLIVPGGGPTADAIRLLAATHSLGDELAHWLALKTCSINGHVLAKLLGSLPITTHVDDVNDKAVVDLYAFAADDERRPDHWPHLWDVTSDSMAVRVAAVAGARELVLLKSIDIASDDWSVAAASGAVDPFFPTAVARSPKMIVRTINLRRFPAKDS
ncbi:MAG: hypothetical protein WCL32_00425 [Planctomycetota bacterium]